MAEKPNVIRPTDDDARALARGLLRSARFGALAVNDASSGFPHVSRVLVGTDWDACPVILISSLSSHSRALAADPRCALLAGEPDKGDPLVWPRISLKATAEPVDRAAPWFRALRQRFLGRHPKAALYVDFADFSFVRLVPAGADLNGGFGKAFRIDAADLTLDTADARVFAEAADLISARISPTEAALATCLAQKRFSDKSTGWHVSGFDLGGLDLSNRKILRRVDFPRPARNHEEFLNYYDDLLNDMP